MMFESISLRSMPISSMPCPERTSTIGIVCCCVSSSTIRSSRRPARSWARSFSRVASREASGADLLQRAARVGLAARRGSRRSSRRSSASCSARSLHARHQLGLHHLTASSVRSRIIDSTSRPDVADLGVLRRLDLDEGRLRELGQPPRDLRLPHAGGADHDDVLRRDLVAQLGRQLLAAPAVAQRDGHRALGAVLPDDVAVELGDDLRGREGGSDAERGWPRRCRLHSVSTVMWSLV